MHDATRSRTPPHPVDNTDWLKTAAIILVSVDHFGYFFMEDDRWWSVFGRFAAPTFFFLVGYAQTRTVPLHWIWLGVMLTLLDSWNADWTWVAPNILLSSRTHPLCTSLCADPCATLRLGCLHPARLRTSRGAADSGEDCRLRRGGMAVGPVRLMPAPICRRHIRCRQRRRNSTLVSIRVGCDRDRRPDAASGLLGRCGRLRLAGTRGILVSAIHLAVFILGLGVLSISLCLFKRGESRIQPPEAIAGALRFIGRHTLEIYAIQLAGSELLVKLVPDLAP